MNAPFASDLLGWKATKNNRLVPNTADTDNRASLAIAATALDNLGIPRDAASGVADPASGRPLERAVAASLRCAMPLIDNDREWQIYDIPVSISDFIQYSHLKKVDALVRTNTELRITLGRDYLIKPDVAVGLPGRNLNGLPFLHAAISCKWTIRSDRVQNIRHENNQMIRHRRERLPHLVTVTAEPLPSRLASIARGTGEVDAVYHIAYDALDQALRILVTRDEIQTSQLDYWEECIGQGRVRPFSDLAPTLAHW
ncbi:type II restriction endonuclease NgoMIV [Sphaerisporangium siamense]|uniref:Restriction endonuclease n=1 Tax=Sphaerisporangium siamense TaxID=795645 RepID=A0A7W7D3P1_9ACTN|nr:NgoMIV family type II restriction endonuclease [Sphaerisporangium siamense]MBB4698765.1 hypothetical protein [Sphaerisporangium siamense]GII89104.1 type II restriction endonuclease NgoMIV [Sphaerisporangium siamense]